VKISALTTALMLFGAIALAGLTERALTNLPVLEREIGEHWPKMPMRGIAAAQIEQESAWNTKAQLKTSREWGRGLGQLTITPQFNAYLEVVKRAELKDWNWQKDPFNVRYQITYLVLQDRANFSAVNAMFDDDVCRWAGALVAYNAGMGTVLKRRSQALASKSVDAKHWFGGLDSVRVPIESKLLYGRNLGEMRNDYPRLIIKVRSGKYEGLL